MKSVGVKKTEKYVLTYLAVLSEKFAFNVTDTYLLLAKILDIAGEYASQMSRKFK